MLENKSIGHINCLLRFANTTFYWLLFSYGQYAWKFFFAERYLGMWCVCLWWCMCAIQYSCTTYELVLFKCVGGASTVLLSKWLSYLQEYCARLKRFFPSVWSRWASSKCFTRIIMFCAYMLYFALSITQHRRASRAIIRRFLHHREDIRDRAGRKIPWILRKYYMYCIDWYFDIWCVVICDVWELISITNAQKHDHSWNGFRSVL